MDDESSFMSLLSGCGSLFSVSNLSHRYLCCYITTVI